VNGDEPNVLRESILNNYFTEENSFPTSRVLKANVIKGECIEIAQRKGSK